MIDCQHKNCEKIKASRTVAGVEFKYSTQKCLDCEATLWSQKNETDFHKWLENLKNEHRDRFTVQKVKVAKDHVEFAMQLSHMYLRSESDVYQACLSYYFFYKPKDKNAKKTLGNNFEKRNAVKGGIELKKFRVNPVLFLSIESNAKLFDLDLNAVASWVIEQVLATAIKEPHTLESLQYALCAA